MPHEAQSTDLIQGTLDLLILKTLAQEPMHSYGVDLGFFDQFPWYFARQL